MCSDDHYNVVWHQLDPFEIEHQMSWTKSSQRTSFYEALYSLYWDSIVASVIIDAPFICFGVPTMWYLGMSLKYNIKNLLKSCDNQIILVQAMT